MHSDTIAAISTPIGEGAIGIVRISGQNAFEIIDDLFVPFSKNVIEEDKKMRYGHILFNNKVIDEVMIVKMKGPATYTREDIVEINCHGGIIAMRNVLQAVLNYRVRMAERGEFTKRAFLNGRLDLSQAESVMDMVKAKTDRGFDIAVNQLSGNLSSKIKQVRNQLIDTMSEIEVSIDYPEEDIEEITYKAIGKSIEGALEDLLNLEKGSNTGKIIREGLKTVIIGRPNVGKSSLMNALLKDQRAIVTEIPGTTRDVIEEFLSIGGIPIQLMDTAGIRDTEDVVEKIGVERTKSKFNEADLIIFMLNASEPLSREDYEIIDKLKGKHVIVILNKIDLNININKEELVSFTENRQVIQMSLKDDIGVELLEKAISDIVYKNGIAENDSNLISNARHIQSIRYAIISLESAHKACKLNYSYELIDVDLKEAILQLGLITGESVEEDLIHKIFSNFCLGK